MQVPETGIGLQDNAGYAAIELVKSLPAKGRSAQDRRRKPKMIYLLPAEVVS